MVFKFPHFIFLNFRLKKTVEELAVSRNCSFLSIRIDLREFSSRNNFYYLTKKERFTLL